MRIVEKLIEFKYFEETIVELSVVQSIVKAALEQSKKLKQKQAELQPVVTKSIHTVFKAWYDYEQKLVGFVSNPKDIVEVREEALANPVLEPFKFTNFGQAARLGKKHISDPNRLEPEIESNPGSPPAMAALYTRVPSARGEHSKVKRALIEMHDQAILELLEIDLVIERLYRTSLIVFDDIVKRKREQEDSFHYNLLDVSCGGNLLAREIEARLQENNFPKKDMKKVVILGLDLDARAGKFTFKCNQAAETSALGWKDALQDQGVRVELLKGHVFSAKTLNDICKWLEANSVSGFDVVAALGILDYFDCQVAGEKKIYIREDKANNLGNRLYSLTNSGGLLIGAVFAKEGLDAASVGWRHLFGNWHLNLVEREVMQRRFSFLEATDFQDITTTTRVQDAKKLYSINRAIHYFVHRKRV